jgi:hypothetical protein
LRSRVCHRASALDLQESDKVDPRRQLIKKEEQAKASIDSNVEQVSHVVEDLFRHRKCRHKELAETEAQLHCHRRPCALYRTCAP